MARLEREMAAANRTAEKEALRAMLSALARPEARFLTLEQAAKALKISAPMARLFMERGALGGSEVDGRWLMTRASVDHILDMRRLLAELDSEGYPIIEEILIIGKKIRHSKDQTQVA